MILPQVKVLLIEDDLGFARLVHHLLSESLSEAFEAVHVGSLEAGLSLLARQSFDVILLDLNLPDSSGVDTVRRVLMAVPAVPILVLTGSEDAAIVHEALLGGAQDYIYKGELLNISLHRTIGYAIDRMRTGAALRDRANRQAVAATVGRIALEATDIQALLDHTVQVVADTLAVDLCYILELQDDLHSLLLRATTDATAVGAPVNTRAIDDDGDELPTLAGYTLLSAKSVVFDDFASEKRFRFARLAGVPLGRQITSGATVIIGGRSRAYGVLAVLTESARHFNEDDLHFLENISGLLAVAIERRQGEERLRSSRDQLDVVLSGVSDGILVQNRTGQVVFANAAVTAILDRERLPDQRGLSLDDFLQQAELIDAAGQPFLPENLPGRRLLNHEQVENTLIGIRIAGHGAYRWCEVHVSIVVGATGEQLVVSVLHDVTESRLVDEKLRFHAHLLDSVGQAVIATNLQDEVTYWNLAAEQLYGWPAAEVMGNRLSTLMQWRTIAAEWGKTLTPAEPLATVTGEFELRRRDGSWFPALVSTRAIADANGEPIGRVGVSVDISERKQAEEALRLSEHRYRGLFEQSNDAIIIHQFDGAIVDVNDRACELLGYDRATLASFRMRDLWTSDTQRRVLEIGKDLRRDGAVRRDLQMLRSGGTAIEVAISSSLLSDTPDLVLSLVRDNTWRNKREAKLQQQNDYLVMLHETTLALVERLHLDTLLDALINRAVSLLGATDGSVSILREDGVLIRTAATGRFRAVIGRPVPQAIGVIGKVLRSGKPVLVTDYNSWPERSRDDADGVVTWDDYTAVMGAPLRSGEAIIGVIALSFINEPGTLGDESLAVLDQLAHLASVAYENARLYTVAQDELAERRRVELALRQSEERARAQYMGNPLPTCTWQWRDADFYLLDSNDAADALTDGKIQGIYGAMASIFYADQPEIQRDLQQCYREKTIVRRQMLYRFRTSGKSLQLAITYGFVAPDLVMLHTEDITERVQAEQRQAELLEENRKLVVQLGRRLTELRRSRKMITTATENLRREIAELLHGRVQTRLLIAWHRLGQCAHLLESDQEAAVALLAQVRDDIDEIREQDVRQASHALHPSIIGIGLMPALRSLAAGFESRLVVTVSADAAMLVLDNPADNAIPPAQRLAIYRVVEEALANCIRHGRAASAQVVLSFSENRTLAVSIRDDGAGFDLERMVTGVGLASIAGRVEEFDGAWQIESSPGAGTALFASIPLAGIQTSGEVEAARPRVASGQLGR